MWARVLRWRWALLAVAILVGALVFAFWPEAVAVEEAEVTRGPMRVGLTDEGVTRVADLYVLAAPVPGYLARIDLEPGDRVEAGRTEVARITSLLPAPLDRRTRGELAAALGASRAAEAGAQASLDLARHQLGRAEPLAARGFVSRAQLDAALAAVRLAEAEVTRTHAETRRLTAAASQPGAHNPWSSPSGLVRLQSPVDGVVLRRLVESEGAVTAGTPLVEIGDLRRLEVVMDLVSNDAAKVRIGNAVEINAWGGDRPIPGIVQRIEPSGRLAVSALGIEEQRVDVIIAIAVAGVPGADALGHGFRVEGTIILWQDENVLRVPVGALVRSDDGSWGVYVDQAGRARERKVTIGHMNSDYAEVLSGLEESDAVILGPGGRISEGSRVRVP
jgi:HlyD family secretion protein